LGENNLFANKKEFLATSSFLLFIFLIRIFFLYQEYQEFLSKPFYYTTATVLEQYAKEKNSKSYQVLKLKIEDGKSIYTTSYIKKNLILFKVRVKIIIDNKLSFQDYLSSFYSRVIIKDIYTKKSDKQEFLLDYILSQHTDKRVQSFYSAIFLATRLDIDLRQEISKLGISHLVALSGFHLGILWAIVFGILNILYSPLQQKYFPYRYSFIDLGFLTVIILGLYLWFVEYPPSLVRSFAMVFLGWIFIVLGVRLVSFSFLSIIILILLIIEPFFLFSISFWFSILGVFYIYLILQWFSSSNRPIYSLLYISFGLFVLMLPIVHIYFGITSYWQLTSPILSIIFILFYPLALLAHILDFGWVFDDILILIFSSTKIVTQNILAQDLAFPYLVSSIFAIWSRLLFIITILMATLYSIYLFRGLF